MNRALRKQHMKRCAFRKHHGGGFSPSAPLFSLPESDWTYSARVPEYQSYDDCTFPGRTGQLVNQPNPELAQVAMAGGVRANARRRTVRNKKQRGGCSCLPSGGSRRQRGGAAGGYASDPSMSVGGNGPNAAPTYSAVPCDGRAGAPNMLNPVGFGADSRAPASFYSLTPNQTGGGGDGGGGGSSSSSSSNGVAAFAGSYSAGNAYDASCYRAPGSQLPVYNAETAGFEFRPSTAAGASLPDGVTAYNEVVGKAARVGGGRKSRKSRKSHKNRQNRKSRQNHKNRKSRQNRKNRK